MDQVTEPTWRHLDQLGPGIRQPFFVHGSDVAVVVDEGTLQDLAGRGTDLRCRPYLPRCTDSDTRTLAKDANKAEDRGTMLTRWVVYRKSVRMEWKKPETFRTDAGTRAHAVGGRTDDIVYGSVRDKKGTRKSCGKHLPAHLASRTKPLLGEL